MGPGLLLISAPLRLCDLKMLIEKKLLEGFPTAFEQKI
jgi:hypothetical protein